MSATRKDSHILTAQSQTIASGQTRERLAVAGGRWPVAFVAKSGAAWNTLLLERAKVFSTDAPRTNLFQAYPFPDNYSLTLTASPATVRYFFNDRARKAYATGGGPVRINTLSLIP